jgi:S1-C subfamily serine protease
MRLSPAVPILAAALAMLVLPAALAAQTAAAPAAPPAPAGCRGTSTSTSSITIPGLDGKPVEFPSYPVIEDVQPGSPAMLGGMKQGDTVVRMDGHDLIANPPTKTYAPGDTVQFVVRRDGAEVPLTIVLGRWDPPEVPADGTRTCRPLGSTGGSD